MTDYEQLSKEIAEVPQVNGIVPVDILNLPSPIGRLVRGMVRDKTLSAAELAAAIEISTEEAVDLANALIEKGYLLEVADDEQAERVNADDDTPAYRIRFARRRKQNISLDL